MNIHKRTRLTPHDREELWKLYSTRKYSQNELAKMFRVSRQTISKTLKRCRGKEFIPRKSINDRYRSVQYGLKRIAKIEASIELRKKSEAKRYNKSYPGELVHFDTKRLPLINGENKYYSREYLFVGIDDFSRELYAGIFPDKTQFSSSEFFRQTFDQCPYTIECAYSDNGTEYKGTKDHAFVSFCRKNKIGQKFTKVRCPQTNGKAERVIRTLMESWHEKTIFKSREHRKQELIRFINYYNTYKPHKGIDNKTPYEKLTEYFELDSNFYSHGAAPQLKRVSANGGGSSGNKNSIPMVSLRKLTNVNNATNSYSLVGVNQLAAS